ncbi:MAG TPA: endonuclease domain-containing protein [Ignavibacteriaceae bacterium]|nr:endonuclease domain-containing protein [Ignavibacteriaceae bacterium]
MTKHYNKYELKETRRHLRKNQTYTEKIVWMYLRNRQMDGYKFRRQPAGRYSVDKFVIDFYCPKLKLAIEIDGSIHNEPGQKEYDLKRQEYLETFGIKFLRLTNEEIDGNPNKAFMKIENEIEVLNLTSSKMPGRKEAER